MARILVIDDDVQLVEMLRQSLESDGHQAVGAPDAEAGLRLFREQPADLIIIDIILPGKNGLETIREVGRDFPEVKIIAITGGGPTRKDMFLSVAKKLGAQRTFLKPFYPTEMLRAVRELLGRV